jgi:hypothetical protein
MKSAEAWRGFDRQLLVRPGEGGFKAFPLVQISFYWEPKSKKRVELM